VKIGVSSLVLMLDPENNASFVVSRHKREKNTTKYPTWRKGVSANTKIN